MSGSLAYTLRNIFKDDPLASNVVFSFLLVVLEKLVDMEFMCPCEENKHYKRWFVASYFLIPAFLAFVLMIGLQKGTVPSVDSSKTKKSCSVEICEKSKRIYESIKNWFKMKGNCIIPVIVWIILLLFDGHYVACGMTDWSGRYVTDDKAAPLKWCETETNDTTLYEERLKKSEKWYFHSQCAGLALTLVMAFVGLRVFTREH